MVKFLTILLVVLTLIFVSAASAEKFLTSDPNPGAAQHRLTVNGSVWEPVAANPDGSAWINIEVPGIPVGQSNCQLEAGTAWVIDGEPQDAIAWSDPTPFVLGRPGTLSKPSNIQLKNNH